MKKTIILLLFFLAVFTLAACGEDNETTSENVVYVTVYPMEYLVKQIAGDTVDVQRVPGSNTHSDSIDWSAKEIIDMINADLLFYVNAGVDTYIPNNADTTFKDADVELIDVSKTITYNQVCYTHTHDHEEEEHSDEESEVCDPNALSDDPHFWLDPVRMLEAAELVRDKLLVTFPENSELYNTNFTVLSAALEKLHEDYQSMADQAVKPIITTSMLFMYWHARYEIEILSLSMSAHSTEDIPGDIIEFVEEAQFHEIQYILFESNTNSPAGEQLLEALQENMESADKLFIHGLGNISIEERDSGKTYMSIMYQNLEVLESATK
ncbi:MAG: metal ABC transporter substrate-binding protein [Candidatus Izemoplasmataceae bacterium]